MIPITFASSLFTLLNPPFDGIPHSLDSIEKLEIKFKSPKFGEISIFPKNTDTTSDILVSLQLTESIASPVVRGTIIINDHANFVENLNLEGYEEIIIIYNKNKREVKFTGIIIDVTLLTDDATLANKMNQKQQFRNYSMTFMNKDIFMANYKTPQGIFEPNEFEIKEENQQPFQNRDFIGWIA